MSFILHCIVLRAAYTSEMFKSFQSGARHNVMFSMEDLNENEYILNVPSYTEFYLPLDEIKFARR